MTSKKRKMPDDSAEADPDSNVGADRHHPRHHQPHRRQFRIGTSAENYFRHLYDKEPDFKQLAKQDADFAAFLQENGQLDFTNPSAVMQLTKTLLKLDFGLKVELPNDRLCPPVPNRHNYILWLKDLLDGATYSPPGAGGRPICGLDVGTGASCIYPLLGTVQRPSWHFLATDIDAESLERAKRNVEINGLSDRVRLLLRSPADALIPSASEFPASFPLAFVMMNPPFYESADEMLSSAAKKSRPPHSACTGAPVEMVCEGGEVAHVGRLLTESLVLRERGAQFYTSMLGKVTSLEVLVGKLRENGIDNYAVTEFVQGNKTKRWAIGWSFGRMRPAEHVARGLSAAGPWRKLLPPVLRMELVSLPAGKEVGPVVERIREVVGGLELISWTWEAEGLEGVGRARENVWSRAWRRKKAREQQQQQQQLQGENGDQTTAEKDKDDEECRLGFAVTVEVGTAETKVTLHWREGHDPLLFESFGGFLQGKLRDLVPEK